jgi:hypothetical protein
MRAGVLFLVACLALPAAAQEPADAPVVLKAGEAAPVSGVLLPDKLAVSSAAEVAGCRVEVPELKAEVQRRPTVGFVILLVAGALVVGAAAGVTTGVVLATAPPK